MTATTAPMIKSAITRRSVLLLFGPSCGAAAVSGMGDVEPEEGFSAGVVWFAVGIIGVFIGPPIGEAGIGFGIIVGFPVGAGG